MKIFYGCAIYFKTKLPKMPEIIFSELSYSLPKSGFCTGIVFFKISLLLKRKANISIAELPKNRVEPKSDAAECI